MKKNALFICLIWATLWTVNTHANPANLFIQLEGYQTLIHKNFAYIIIPDVNHPYKEQYRISDEGNMHVSLLISHSREVILSYDDREISLILSPGDQAELHLSMETFQQAGPIKGRFKGVHQEAVMLMLTWQPTISDWISTATNAFVAEKSTPEGEYREVRLLEMTDVLNAFQTLVAKEKIDNQFFLDWAKSQIRYAAANDLCLFPFMGKVNTSINESVPYFDFIHRFSPENDFVSSLQSYTNYLKTLISNLNIIGNIAEKHKDQRDSLKSSGNTFPLKFDIFSKTLTGTERQLALTNLYLHAKRIPQPYLDSLSRYLPLSEIQKMDTQDLVGKTTLLELLTNFPLRDAEKQPLLELYQQSSGKVVYHDFWFLGCAPCMRELPHYNQLIEKAGAEVEFIFYGVYMEEKEWKEAVVKYGIKGRHYLLSKNQMAFFERYFALNGFPHHQILDAQGMIVPGKLPGVHPEQFDWILQALEKAKGKR
ncbi:MAG: TlpA family protein disulfide reductase [Saprospiraceae bacterium]|nr:TlpA family protein disulfide reductase [Saprospiraceae bacterium]